MTPVELHAAVLAVANDAELLGTLPAVTFDAETALEADEWVRFSIRSLDTADVTLGGTGNRLVRHRARLIIQAFASRSLADGPGRSLALAQRARDLFHGSTINDADPVTFGTAAPSLIPSGGDPWVQHNVSIPLTYTERI